MEKRLIAWLAAVLIASNLASCGESGATFDAAAHAREVLDWQERRIARLKLPSGHLNQTGLYWTEPGTYTFGSADSNDIVFAGDAASHFGVFTVSERGVSMTVLHYSAQY